MAVPLIRSIQINKKQLLLQKNKDKSKGDSSVLIHTLNPLACGDIREILYEFILIEKERIKWQKSPE
jgi:hypothetical protein